MSLNLRAAELLAAQLTAAAAAPPSARILEPLAREAAAKGVAAAMATRRPASGRVSATNNAVRISFTGPGSLAAQRRALAHLDGRIWPAVSEVYQQTVKALGGRAR